MTPEQLRERAIKSVTQMLRMYPFKVEYKVKKKPQGIKVIVDVTQEHMNFMIANAARKGSK